MTASPAPPPILLLIFNRPETTRRVFDVVRKQRPPRLYVAADGARDDRPGERELCQAARGIAQEVDWKCDVRLLFRDSNLGCRAGVSGAIDWFFEQEESGIILEDDCVTSPSFFRFAGELLERYRDDERVMAIAASHFPGDAHQPSSSYFFSRFNHCWGWATWRRAWKHNDLKMSTWPALRKTDWLLQIGNGSQSFRLYWTRHFDAVYKGELDSWAYAWTFSCWAQNGLTALPAKNLVKNIGFGPNATHTSRWFGSGNRLPLQELTFPLMHPRLVIPDAEADNWTTRHHFQITARRTAFRELRRLASSGLQNLRRNLFSQSD